MRLRAFATPSEPSGSAHAVAYDAAARSLGENSTRARTGVLGTDFDHDRSAPAAPGVVHTG